MDDEIVQYYVVNSELPMSKGKIAAQVAHVATLIAENLVGVDETFYNWLYGNHQKKIILRGKEKDLKRLIELPFTYSIKDLGLTEIPPGSLTCVGFAPMPKAKMQKYVKRLQLLKD